MLIGVLNLDTGLPHGVPIGVPSDLKADVPLGVHIGVPINVPAVSESGEAIFPDIKSIKKPLMHKRM